MANDDVNEVEVYRLTTFSKDMYYEFAIKTRTEGKWPNERHYTSNKPQYLGKYLNSENWGYGDNRGGAENFIDETGKKTKIIYDYAGLTCFRSVCNLHNAN